MPGAGVMVTVVATFSFWKLGEQGEVEDELAGVFAGATGLVPEHMMLLEARAWRPGSTGVPRVAEISAG